MKLKSEDLMLGNLLDFNGMICVVKEIDSQGVVVYIEETKKTEWIDLFQFSPVFIDEEWLIKLGYQYYNNHSEGTMTKDFDGKLDIDYYENQIQLKSHYEGYHLYRPLRHIRYVHQLQNLYYALSGEELKINLQDNK